MKMDRYGQMSSLCTFLFFIFEMGWKASHSQDYHVGEREKDSFWRFYGRRGLSIYSIDAMQNRLMAYFILSLFLLGWVSIIDT